MNNRIKKMRIPVELEQLRKTQSDHGPRATDNDCFSQLLAIIPGPKGTPYEQGQFKVSIQFGEQYPFRPPTFKFVTPVYHPNIDNSGQICLDLLRMPPTGTYNPAITLESILISIQLLLATPNPDDPLQGDAADLFKSNRRQFDEKARQHVRKYCKVVDTDNAMDTDAVEEEETKKTRDEMASKKLKLSH